MMASKYIPGKHFTGEPCKNGHVSERWNYNGMCVVCKRESDKKSNLRAGKKYRIKKDYGLSIDELDSMFVDQDHKCAICDEPFNNIHKTQIDHCHSTGIVRGLLCINCNWMLGKSRDSAEILRKAANYLERSIKDAKYNLQIRIDQGIH